jgi:DNA-directed RNA polymerase specialized sigma24 family protein
MFFGEHHGKRQCNMKESIVNMPRPKREVPIDRYVVKTMREVAEELGCSPQAVSDVEQRAFRKLKQAFVEQRIVSHEGRYSNG